jgi:hypothetical protein
MSLADLTMKFCSLQPVNTMQLRIILTSNILMRILLTGILLRFAAAFPVLSEPFGSNFPTFFSGIIHLVLRAFCITLK